MWFLIAVVSVGTTLGFLGDVWWVFDLFAHFRLHYVLLLMVVILVATLRRRGWLIDGGVAGVGGEWGAGAATVDVGGARGSRT